MQQTELNSECLLGHALLLIEKIEKRSTENLLKGSTDKVILLANVRHLSTIVKQLKERNGQ